MKKSILVNLICSFISVMALMFGILFAVEFNGGSMSNRPQLVISTESSTVNYTGNPITNDKWHLADGTLKDGHRLEVNVTGTQTNVGISANHASAKVYDANGKDVSSQYNIQYSPGTLNVKARDLAIEAASASKKYDGRPLEKNDYTLESPHQLIEGHTLAVAVSGSITEIGETDNKIVSVYVRASDGTDVTSNYNIITESGKLTVYGEDGDGGAGSPFGPGGPIISGSLLDGIQNNSTFFLVDSSVTQTMYLKIASYGNYDTSISQFVDAPVYSGLISDTYSAYYLPSYSLSSSGLSSLSAKITPKLGVYAIPYYTIAGSYPQTSDTVISGDATDVYYVDHYKWSGLSGPSLPSMCVDFESDYGKFVRENYLSIDPETAAFMNGIIAENDFSATDKEIINKVARYIQNAADYNLEYDREMESADNIIIAFLSKYKEGVCRHYAAAATMLYRALGIPARYTVGFVANVRSNVTAEVTGAMAHAWVEVYVDGFGWVNVEVTGSDSQSDKTVTLSIKPKDVREIYQPGNTVYASDEVEGFTLSSEEYSYVATVDGSVSGLGIAKSSVVEFEIYDKDGELVYQKSTGLGANKFNVKYNEGEVQQYLSRLVFTSNDRSKVYNGVALITTLSDCIMTEGDLHGYTCVITPTGTNDEVGFVSSTFDVNIYKDGVDCTSHFYVVRMYGKLTINPKEIVITAASAEKKYDGTALTREEIIYDENMLAYGDFISNYVVEGSQKSIGESANVLKSVTITNSNGEDVTENYTITIRDGMLVVTAP